MPQSYIDCGIFRIKKREVWENDLLAKKIGDYGYVLLRQTQREALSMFLKEYRAIIRQTRPDRAALI